MDWIFSGGINASDRNNPYRNELLREEKPILNEVGSVEFGQVREDGDDREKRIQERYKSYEAKAKQK